MSHLDCRGLRPSIAPRTAAGAIDGRKGLGSSSLDGRLPVARALVCGLLCALALVVLQAARPESAQAAKVTRGVVTGTVYFNKGETRFIATHSPRVVAHCLHLLPGWSKAVCAYAGAWWVQAVRARNRGMCLKVKFLRRSPAIHWPDIYRGGYCR